MEFNKLRQIVSWKLFRNFENKILFFTAEDSCKVFCKTKTGVKSRSWIFPDGTSCRNENSDIDDSYYCVNGRCEVNKLILTPELVKDCQGR